jgi:hypothetical protein
MAGDADFSPALAEVLRCDPSIRVAVAGFSHSMSRVYSTGNLAGYCWQRPPILLDGFLQDLPKDSAGETVQGRAYATHIG